jgi:hypothetical protein
MKKFKTPDRSIVFELSEDIDLDTYAKIVTDTCRQFINRNIYGDDVLTEDDVKEENCILIESEKMNVYLPKVYATEAILKTFTRRLNTEANDYLSNYLK